MDFRENVWAYYTARLMAGLAVGGISVAAPMYVAELAEAKIRGTLGTFFQLQVTVGLLLGYILGKSDFRGRFSRFHSVHEDKKRLN